MYWFKRLFRKEARETQLDKELRFHMEARAAHLVESGCSLEEATRRAGLEFGGVEGVKQQCREARKVHLAETVFQDILYGLRLMRRSPGFTLVAILTLALGIGANTAIFSVIDCVLLRPLPFPDSLQLVRVYTYNGERDGMDTTFATFLDWRAQNRSFQNLAATWQNDANLLDQYGPEKVRIALATANLFETMGVQPLLGRGVSPDIPI
jgi:hypothetical protein